MFNKSALRGTADENGMTRNKSKEVRCDVFFFVLRERGMENQGFRERERKNRSKVFIFSHIIKARDFNQLAISKLQLAIKSRDTEFHRGRAFTTENTEKSENVYFCHTGESRYP